MRRIKLLFLFLPLFCIAGEKDWPPKLDKNLVELTEGITTKAELAEMEALIAKWKRTGDRKIMNKIDRIYGGLVRRLTGGDMKQWSMKDFKYRVKEAKKIGVVRDKACVGNIGRTYTNRMWRIWKDWAACAKTRRGFFERLIYGYKNKKEIKRHAIIGVGFKQAVYKFMENNLKLFPGKKEKILFCRQLIAAGFRDQEIRKMPSEIIKGE